ncbi:unnamed protein product [Cuscuta epithymum]|uniref:Uncharacterized protein n=1 Tax=Cuscuta epithymum TaxID=186058 RepID=A0AAV0F3S3_9ASTE|nr:unnamed protein product [Cuscuta epithymum]
MEDRGSGGKVTGIRQIVRLKEILNKWQSVTLGQKRPKNGDHSAAPANSQQPPPPPPPYSGISPAVCKRLMSCSSYCDSDEESCQSPDPPSGVPRGYLAVYVGPELRRFIIPTSYLSDPLFKVLLEKVEEEFGFDHSGALTIPCETETFKYLLKCMENHEKEQGTQQQDDTAGSSHAVEK